MLAHYEVPVEGRSVVVVGRGPTLGRPLALLLSLKEPGANAAVTVVHTGVKDWPEYTRRADIVVGAAGVPNMITPDVLAPGSCVIGGGMTWEGRRALSDVDERCAASRRLVTPRLGGVGVTTVAMLMANTVAAAETSPGLVLSGPYPLGMATVSELLAAGKTYSFEFFPPKNDSEQARLVETLLDLQPLRPSFVSVTYRGGPSSRQRTTDLVFSMLRLTALNPMAHLTCAGHSRLELADILVGFRKAGVENLMALGGDPPTDASLGPGELAHAQELVELARAIGGFCIGVAAHPGRHPRSRSLASDRRFLAQKLRAADFAVTQFFFEPSAYFSLVDDLAARGVDKPVLPGILPVTNLSSVPRMAEMGCAPPAHLVERLEAAARGGRLDVVKAGVDAATELCSALLDQGAPGPALLYLNRSEATRRIHANLGLSVAAG